jgi:hypothetical protein
MDRNTSTERTPFTSLPESFERYLQDKREGRQGLRWSRVDLETGDDADPWEGSVLGDGTDPLAGVATAPGPEGAVFGEMFVRRLATQKSRIG